MEGRTIVVATVPPSGKRPICVVDKEDKPRAYIRIADENIVASPVHLAIWREAQNPQGVMMTYTETVSKLLAAMEGQRLTLNQIVKRSGIARHKVIALLARLIRFNIVRWDYDGQQFLFQTVDRLKDEWISVLDTEKKKLEFTNHLATAKEYLKEEEANANLKKIQETGYFSDLQVYMKEDNKAYKPDERDSFQS